MQCPLLQVLPHRLAPRKSPTNERRLLTAVYAVVVIELENIRVTKPAAMSAAATVRIDPSFIVPSLALLLRER